MDCPCCMEKIKLLTLNSYELSVKAVAFLGLSFEFYDLSELPYNLYTSFCSLNTNDAGEHLLAQSAHIVFGEFKKFMIRNAAIIINNDEGYLSLSDEQNRKWITFNLMPIHLDRVWRHMILYNHQKYKEFCNILVGGYIHRTIPDKFQPECAYINDLLEINSAFVFNQEDMSTYSFENFQEYEVQMTLTEIDDAILTIKENLELFSNKDIILKLNNNYNDKVCFSIFQDLKEEINNSDKECYFLFQELIDVNFPSSMLKCIESKLRIDSDSCLILIIEYFKFLILKSKHPSECISSFFIDKVWIEHCVLTKHFHDICDKVLNIDEEVLHYTPPPTDAIAFKDKYEQTIILYRKIFGCEPHPQIWRDLNIEYNDFQKSLYNVNLERLVNYYRFEDEILSPILADLDIPNKAKFFDKIVNDYAKLNWNINNFSGTKMRLMLFNREIRQKAGKHIASSHLWRKYCVIDDNVITSASLKSDKNLYCVGGFKFSCKKGYQLDYYWYINDDDNLLINLDDLADDSCESVHLYIDKGSHNLNLNNDLIEGQEEADLHFCTKYQR